MTKKTTSRIYFCFTLLLMSLLRAEPFAYAEGKSALAEMSLEDLMNLEVTSVSKKNQTMDSAPAAIFVLTQEDIRRSGALSIPEVLRLVPGLNVARIDATHWSITARGFGGVFANKLLVLMDGRSIYTPLYSGVYWDAQDTVIEDIERIEVIRGPGGALWGANAVNGVINIITRKASETKGGLVSAGAGNEERGFASVRYGTAIDENTDIRLYSKALNRDNMIRTDDQEPTFDNQRHGQAGFRMDSNQGKDNFTIQGDLLTGIEGHETSLVSFVPQIPTSITKNRTDYSAANILGRWQREISSDSNLCFQAYYDRSVRNDTTLNQTYDTADFDFQHGIRLSESNDLLWGIGFRQVYDRLETPTRLINFDPDQQSSSLYSGFIQDEIPLFTENLKLTLGSKFEQGDYVGFQWQPNVRLIWTASDSVSFWGAVSRAVKVPSRSNRNIDYGLSVVPLPNGDPALLAIRGNPNLDSESMLAWETGVRSELTNEVSVDITGFLNRYSDMQTLEVKTPEFQPSQSPPVRIPLDFKDKGSARTWGSEAVINWRPIEFLRFQATHSLVLIHTDLEHGSSDTSLAVGERGTPRNQSSLRALVDLPWNLEFDNFLRYIDSVPVDGIDSYVDLSSRIGWRPSESFEFSVSAENLLDSKHPEAKEVFTGIPVAEIQRSIFAKVIFRF